MAEQGERITRKSVCRTEPRKIYRREKSPSDDSLNRAVQDGEIVYQGDYRNHCTGVQNRG